MQARQDSTMPLVRSVRPGGGSLCDTPVVLAGSAPPRRATAWVRVPMWPVPMAMRSFAVPLVGASRGPRRGAAGVTAHLAEAALGRPVLAGGKASVLGGPTPGRLLGFLPAAVAVGWAAQKDRTRRGWPAPFGVRLLGARLLGARLLGARLLGARPFGARLLGARLLGARLLGARLLGARLLGARLLGARLLGARLLGARLLGARPFGRTLMHRPGLAWPHAAWLHDPRATLAAGLLPPPLGDALNPLLAVASPRLLHGAAASRHHPHG